MKRILFSLLIIVSIFCLTGCDEATNSVTIEPTGEIVKVFKYDDKVVIYVKFYSKSKQTSYKFALTGSDTCRVGQKLTLK